MSVHSRRSTHRRSTGRRSVRALVTAAMVTLLTLTLAGRAQAGQPDPVDLPSVPEHTWAGIGPYAHGGQMTPFPDDPRRMIVTGQNSRFYFETLDGGHTWQAHDRIPVGDGVLLRVVVDPANSRRLWAVMSSEGRDPGYLGRLYVSDDTGGTWRQLAAPNRRYRDLDVHASGAVLVATSYGVGSGRPAAHISRDGGATWTDSGISSTWLGPSTLVGDTLYLSTREGIVRVPDVRDPASPPRVVFAGRGGFFAWMRGVAGDADVVVADTMFEGVWASTDDGATWQQVRPYRLGTSLVTVSDGEIVVGYTDEVQLSRDGGATWRVQPDPWPATFATDVARWGIGQTAGLYLSGASAGIVRVTERGYERVGIPAARAFDIAVAAQPGTPAPTLAVGTTQDVYATAVAGHGGPPVAAEWGESGAEGLAGRSAIALAASAGVLYKVIENHVRLTSVHRSDDGGRTWRALTEPSTAIVHALLTHPADPSLIAVSVSDIDGPEVRVSTDGGATWRVTTVDQPLLDLAADPMDPTRVYGVGPAGLWGSRDRGATFTRVNDQPGDRLAVAAGGRLVMSRAGQVFTSADGGLSLRPATGLPSDSWIADLAYAPDDPRVVVAATSAWTQGGQPRPGAGVLRSDDGGLTWRSYNRGLPVWDVRAVAFHPDGRHLYAVTTFGGAYRVRT